MEGMATTLRNFLKRFLVLFFSKTLIFKVPTNVISEEV